MKKGKYIYALGTFDGVHLGHQALICAAAALAKKSGCTPAAYTFEGLPRAAVEGREIPLLQPTGERYMRLSLAGAEHIVHEPFAKLRELSPEGFVYYLIGHHSAEGFVCGSDYRFGRNGAGDAETLKKLAAACGKRVEIVDFTLDERGEKISSRAIREAVEQGHMREAAAALGYPFSVSGVPQGGKGLARQWGTPTVNLPLPQGVTCPRYGVYASRVWIDGKRYPAITNIGVRPTFDDGDTPNAETFVLEGNFEHIGVLTVELWDFIRPERPFSDTESLQKQIKKDIQSVKNLW